MSQDAGAGGTSQHADAEVRLPRTALSPVQRALIAVHTAVGLRATLQAIVEGVTDSTPYQEAAITVAEVPYAAELRTIAVVGPPAAQAKLLGTTCRRAALLEFLAEGEAWGSMRFRSSLAGAEGIVTYRPEFEPLDVPDAWLPHYELNAPLYAPDGELIGMLSMDTPSDGRIPPAWVNEILELFAEQAMIAILNARRHEQALGAMQTLERERAELHAAFAEQCERETRLYREARRDPLTGLANRILLQERLEELLAGHIPVVVVFCDLDHFKQINDTHGHGVGDEVLRATARHLTRNLADLDVVARIGGDEFVVVAGGVEQQDAPLLLRRIDEAFTTTPVSVGGLQLQVSSSLGLVCDSGRSESRLTPAQRVEELLQCADREMYAQKRSRAGVKRLLTLSESQRSGAAG